MKIGLLTHIKNNYKYICKLKTKCIFAIPKNRIMRELEEHFCNFTQSQELIKLGCNYPALAVSLGSTLRQVPINYKPHPVEIKIFLRSQALDFFMDKGYDFHLRGTKYNWYSIDPFGLKNTPFTSGNYDTYPEAESALIDKLIELEMEVQNGE